MVGLQVLDLAILVRIQVPEPQDMLNDYWISSAKQAGRAGPGYLGSNPGPGAMRWFCFVYNAIPRILLRQIN